MKWTKYDLEPWLDFLLQKMKIKCTCYQFKSFPSLYECRNNQDSFSLASWWTGTNLQQLACVPTCVL